MSQDHPGNTTRRTFLGAATAGTPAPAATLATPDAAKGQSAGDNAAGMTKLAQMSTDTRPQPAAPPPRAGDWTTPAAMSIPKEGYFKLEQGRYGPIYPRTPANYGFTVIAKVKPGREDAIRAYGKTIEDAVKGAPTVLAPL